MAPPVKTVAPRLWSDRVAGEACQCRDPIGHRIPPDRAQGEEIVQGQCDVTGQHEAAGNHDLSNRLGPQRRDHLVQVDVT